MRFRPLLLSALFLLPAGIVSAATANISARVDGLSELILSGNTVRWHHVSYSPPGDTTVNGVVWTPTGLSSFCNCDSDPYTGLVPPLIQSTVGYSVVTNAGRGPVTILETPSSANGWALRIRIDDEAPGGDDLYDIDVSYPAASDPVAVPAASTAALAFLGGLLALAGAWALRR
jgi:hypothetical protein